VQAVANGEGSLCPAKDGRHRVAGASKEASPEPRRSPPHGGTLALLELRQRSAGAAVVEVAVPTAAGQPTGRCSVSDLRLELPGDLDGRRRADHPSAPAGTVSFGSALTDATVGASEVRTTRPPQRPHSVSIVGSRKRALDQSWPHASHMRVGGFPAMAPTPQSSSPNRDRRRLPRCAGFSEQCRAVDCGYPKGQPRHSTMRFPGEAPPGAGSRHC
jgi:hypothetical protein